MLELQVIGHVGQDAKIQEKNGKTFLSFSVAHSDRTTYIDEETGEEVTREVTYWVSVTSKQEKLAPYLKSGKQVMVRGNMRLRPYFDKKENKEVVGINLNANLIQLLGKKEKEEN